jgi:GDSL-like Lipase/Acylhydrolase family
MSLIRSEGFRAAGMLNFKAFTSIGSSTSWRPSFAQAYPALIGADRGFRLVYNLAEDSTTATEMLERFDELLRHRPGTLSIMTGAVEAINSASVSLFEAEVREMVERAQSIGSKVTLCTEPIQRNPIYRAAMPTYMDVLREVAGDTSGVVLFEVFDHFDAMTESQLDAFYEVDGAHLNEAGQQEILALAREAGNASAFRAF